MAWLGGGRAGPIGFRNDAISVRFGGVTPGSGEYTKIPREEENRSSANCHIFGPGNFPILQIWDFTEQQSRIGVIV